MSGGGGDSTSAQAMTMQQYSGATLAGGGALPWWAPLANPAPPPTIAQGQTPDVPVIGEPAANPLAMPQTPTLSTPATMPSMASPGVMAAKKNARDAILNRAGRASTVLTNPSLRSARPPRPTIVGGADLYARSTSG